MEHDVINRDEFLQYLLQTQASLEHYPDYPLKEELDELVAQYTEGRDILPLLERAAEKERHLIEIGLLEDEDGDGVGFFGALLELFSSLQGLGRINWSALRDKARHLTQKINRVNPATIAARNALRVLLSMNIFGYATAIMKSASVKQKVINLYKQLGGKEANIIKALQTGARKKPLLKRSGTVHGLGSTDVSVLLKRAGAFLNQIKTWIAQIQKSEKQNELKAILTLLEMNYGGYASTIAKYSSLKQKVINLFVQKGGRSTDIIRAINIGSKKRAYVSHSGIRPNFRPKAPIPPSRLRGVGELGEPVSISALLASAGAFLLKIKKWIAEAGIKINVSTGSKTAPQTTQPSQSAQKAQTQTSQTATKPANAAYPSPTMPSYIDRPQFEPSARVNVGGSSKGFKIIAGVGVTAGIFFLGRRFLLKHSEPKLKGISFQD